MSGSPEGRRPALHGRFHLMSCDDATAVATGVVCGYLVGRGHGGTPDGPSVQQHLKDDDDQAEGAVDQARQQRRRPPPPAPAAHVDAHPTSCTTPFHGARRTAGRSLRRPSAPAAATGWTAPARRAATAPGPGWRPGPSVPRCGGAPGARGGRRTRGRARRPPGWPRWPPGRGPGACPGSGGRDHRGGDDRAVGRGAEVGGDDGQPAPLGRACRRGASHAATVLSQADLCHQGRRTSLVPGASLPPTCG
jgi:hypothetical protein